jgi:fucose permease
MGAIGIAVLPALCGVSAQALGLESIPLLLTACWLLLLGTYAMLNRLTPGNA